MAAPGFNLEKYTASLLKARDEIREYISESNTNPIMLRTAWHDAGSFAGAQGTIRFDEVMNHGANAGLKKVVGFLKPIKEKHNISWADTFQMAGALAVELAGGPKILMRYGRMDSDVPSKEGALPGALAPWKEKGPAAHLRAVFGRMGFSDREIVALSGSHTIGRAFKERSGTVDESAGKGTQYTMPPACPRFDGAAGMGMSGGRSWTKKWLSFDNSYFTQIRSNLKGGPGSASTDGLLWLPTDAVLATDPGFAPYFKLYAANQDAFFEDYAEAHRRLSEQNAKWAVPGGIMLPDYPKARL